MLDLLPMAMISKRYTIIWPQWPSYGLTSMRPVAQLAGVPGRVITGLAAHILYHLYTELIFGQLAKLILAHTLDSVSEFLLL